LVQIIKEHFNPSTFGVFLFKLFEKTKSIFCLPKSETQNGPKCGSRSTFANQFHFAGKLSLQIFASNQARKR